MKKFKDPQRGTNPLIWAAAIICAIVAVGVIAIGIFVLVSYLVIHPKTPSISVSYANLDKFNYAQSGDFDIQLTVVVKAKNENSKTHASFYDMVLILGFHGLEVAKLVNDPFDVEKNSSVEFPYVVDVNRVPLRGLQQNYVQSALRRRMISLELKGKAKTRWRVWILGGIRFTLHIDCDLQFFVPNGSFSEGSSCTSKAH